MTTTRPSGYGVDYARRALAICWLSSCSRAADVDPDHRPAGAPAEPRLERSRPPSWRQDLSCASGSTVPSAGPSPCGAIRRPCTHRDILYRPVLGDLGARCTMTRPAREESA
jgi:hypothetical protein